MNLKIVTYYGYYNSKGEVDDSGDHWGIDVINTDDNTVLTCFGDEYHDSGQAKLEGFLEGLMKAGVEVSLTYCTEAHEDAELFDED